MGHSMRAAASAAQYPELGRGDHARPGARDAFPVRVLRPHQHRANQRRPPVARRRDRSHLRCSARRKHSSNKTTAASTNCLRGVASSTQSGIRWTARLAVLILKADAAPEVRKTKDEAAAALNDGKLMHIGAAHNLHHDQRKRTVDELTAFLKTIRKAGREVPTRTAITTRRCRDARRPSRPACGRRLLAGPGSCSRAISPSRH